MKLDTAIEDVQDAEAGFAKRLRAVAERHAAEHDLYHMGHTLARQCAEHLERLAPFADRYGASARSDDVAESPGLLETVRRKSGELLGRSESSGLLLLKDLRSLYLAAQEVEIAWVILIQAAKAVRDRELLDAASSCHQEAETRGKWLRTRIKEASPQVLATG
ncbi:MAG TPA: hypothetical protein VI357_19070 [Mycobacteriales bacterium]